MKNLLGLLILCVAVSQISAAKLTLTILYETLCKDTINLFKTQVYPTFQDAKLRENVHVELVPFGRAKYTENPWNITCQYGPDECLGNVMNACFMARHADNWKQINFVSCCFFEPYPPHAGEKCAKKLNYSYEGVQACTTNKEGIQLQIKNGKRTVGILPKLPWVPTIVYDNVFNDKDHKESLTNLKAVITRKLKAKGVNL